MDVNIKIQGSVERVAVAVVISVCGMMIFKWNFFSRVWIICLFVVDFLPVVYTMLHTFKKNIETPLYWVRVVNNSSCGGEWWWLLCIWMDGKLKNDLNKFKIIFFFLCRVHGIDIVFYSVFFAKKCYHFILQ